MKKLYIPTSTFNFNNILSSESISPKAFYEHRKFGYSRWLEIPENHIENVILLYDKPVGFSRPSSDIEDHPLLIEICIEEEFPQSVKGVFYSDHTIYLSPWRTRFIFFSEQDKRITLSLSDSSLETKLIGLYQKGFCVEKPAMINIPKIELNVGLNQEKIEYDYRVNKLKGLLYGYYIGALLSSTPEVIRKVNLLQELQDIFFSVLSTEDRSFTAFQKERINLLFDELQKESPLILFMRNKLTVQEIEHCISLGMIYPDMIDKVRILNDLRYSPADSNSAVDWLKKQQNVLQLQIRKARNRLEPFAEEIIVTDKSLNKISNVHLNESREECLAIAWINEVLLLKNYNGKVGSFKEKISDEVTTKAKEIYKEAWEGSSAKSLLNQMRKYVRGQENTFQWNNLLISSMAAVIAKGDDWEQLLAFMQSKSMVDYRLAFAFWGELNGFANLTRDFTDNFFTIDDRTYVANVYKELHGQLLETDPTLKTGLIMPSNELTDYSTTFVELKNKVLSIFKDYGRDKGRCRNKDKLQKGLLLALQDNRDNQDPEIFLYSLCTTYTDYGWSRKNKPWKYMNERLLTDNKEEKSNELILENEKINNRQERSLFLDDMLKDKSWAQVTSGFISDKKIKKQYLKDVEWFVGNHSEKYCDENGRKGIYLGKDVDNKSVIDRFYNYLENKRNNSKVEWLMQIYQKVPIKQIIQYLRKNYGY